MKATREAPLRGGVLADAVGAGKTVNALALVAARAEQARRGVAARPAELQHAGATLVVAPLHCLRPVRRHQMPDTFTMAARTMAVRTTAILTMAVLTTAALTMAFYPNPNTSPKPKP